MIFTHPKETTTNCFYELLDSKGKLIPSYRFEAHACYSSITMHGNVPKEAHFIRTWIGTEYSPYNEQEAKDWIKEINNFTLESYYEGIKDKKHSFLIPVYDRPNNIKRGLMATLMAVRYIWEYGLYEIPFNYFSILEAYPKANKFKAFQLAHYFIKSHYPNLSGHSIFGSTKREFLGLPKFKKIINTGASVSTIEYPGLIDVIADTAREIKPQLFLRSYSEGYKYIENYFKK